MSMHIRTLGTCIGAEVDGIEARHPAAEVQRGPAADRPAGVMSCVLPHDCLSSGYKRFSLHA